MKRSFLFILVFFLSILLVACGSNVTETDSDKSSNGDKDSYNKLTMYTTLPEENAEAYIKEFEKDTGIDVDYLRLSTGEILSKLESQKGHSDASIWFAGPSDSFIEADEKGLLEKYDPDELPNYDKIDKSLLIKGANWLPIYQGPIAIASNKKWLEKNNLEAPKSWDDLLKPEFKNNIMLAHPGASGTGYTIVSTLVQTMGEEKAFDYLKDFNKNVKQWTKSGSSNAQLIGIGEVGVGLAFAQDLLPVKDEGYPIILTYPKDGVPVAVEGAAKIKGGPEKEKKNAKKFMKWINSDKGQNVYANTGFYHLPVIQGAKIPKGAPNLNDLNVADTDNVWGAKHRNKLVNKFDKQVVSEDKAKDK